MFLSPSPIHELRCSTPGLSPAIASRRYRKGLKAEHLHAPSCTRKGNQLKVSSRVRQTTRRRKAHTLRIGWDRDEREDCRRIASDLTVELPGEWQRTPRLERQEAFRAPQTWDNVVVDDAALYRLGILYDDDDGDAHARGSGFGLDTIVHAEPIYSLRPAKRGKRAHHRVPLKEEDLYLSVDLLSTYLGDDAVIARFLAPMSDEEPARLHPDDRNGINRPDNGFVIGEGSAEPLSIVYELIENSTHSLAPIPAASDFPDLVSDTEEEDSGDWALVPGSSTDPSGNAVWLDTNVGVVTDGETTSPVGGAWIFLAGDDS
ncbi:hypothetical protein E0Z10_g4795 [Xylaria hypoxylon]|uniref:Uncharacterized protein n=1 Tax=Xylaria hypoxylon TaxID=37992 RepID=A0A4Z0Z5T6_9PEZI|nr:hypothetical protein E0Z10_g4795 [Xylaria hypoxylon]